MEDIRKRLMAGKDGALELFPAKARPQKQPPASTSIISISSTESSPDTSESSRNKVAEIRKPARVIDLDSDTSYGTASGSFEESPLPQKPKSGVKPKRLIWESDPEDEGDRPPPSFPMPQLAKPSGPSFPEAQLPAKSAPPSKKEYAPFPFQQSFKENSASRSEQPVPIRVPTNPPPSLPWAVRAGDNQGALWETFEDPDSEHLHDPQRSAADAERHLQDLVQQSMNDTNENIDMSLATVKGFKEDFKLLPHQVVGRTWMRDRESGKSHGGILADDMGLGKTIQTLTRIVDGRPRKSDKDDGYAATTLVVSPVGLVSQWASEIARIAIGLRVVEHHGSNRTKDPEVLKRAHIVVTSYSIVSSEHGAYDQPKNESKAKKKKNVSDDSDSDDSDTFARSVPKKSAASKKKPMDALFHVNWWRIVLDEAHNIKNRKTKAAIACCALKGKYRWCLTGTPMQNNVEELFSLLQFLKIRPLNDWETFNNQINKPVKSGRSVRAMKRLHVVLKAIMLRRKKDTILNGQPLIKLPDRKLEIVECQFDPEEREFYEAIENKVELTLNKFIKNGDMNRNYTSMLVLLLRLRQACNHPSLISKDISFDRDAVEPKAVKEGNDLEDEDELTDMFGKLGMSGNKKCSMCQAAMTSSNTNDADAKYCDDCSDLATKSRRKSLATIKGSSISLPPESAKTRMIMELLEEIRGREDGEEKTIIFSQFTSMLDIIQPFLQDAGIKYVRYDGSMRKDKREESLEKIRNANSVKVILISFKAGSTGLNLTACNNVILVDMWWNPALEDQAFDRAHRLGQTRNVNIYKLTVERTVEERILALQEKKRELAAAALSGDKIKNSKLGMDDLMALFHRSGRDEDEDEDD